MAQHDMDIANASGATVRADINAALQALATCSSGATAPATSLPFELWADTANDLLKQRNAANSAWINVLKLSTGASLISESLSVVTPTTFGYGAGAGGTVTQATSKSTAVTLNKPCGQVTMNAASLAAGAQAAFLVNNSLVTSTDVVVLTLKSVSNDASYNLWCVATNGAISVYLKNISGTALSDALVINFAIIKGATA